ncbi:MAG: restriction endonuclease subunit S [Fibrobacter sp.]|nr:restriction endonuclease subunit S [Fibrobacter sp.]MBR6124939.1 restriction endonuclease subunit S [Candidatus Saccharibacteria bacterium]MBR6125976.1 restriction endonuclease subunit S [Candidatus Saccharibacteria bacterium]
MGSSKLTIYKLGDLIEPLDERNSDGKYGVNDVRGVSNLKQMMRTKADLYGRDLRKFQIVKPGYFVFNHRTSRNGSKFSITYNYDSENHIFTEDYVVFRVKENCLSILSPKWLYIYFCRAEFDRYVITNSWGSSTEFFNWDDLCDVSITLPDLQTQQKYANVYDAMCANQKAYEKGLDDLKLTCDAYIEELRRKMPCEKIGPYIKEENLRNKDNKLNNVQGVRKDKTFIPTIANMNGIELINYKIVKQKWFAYSNRINIGSIALRYGAPCLVSPSYTVFSVDEKIINPEYLILWLQRDEFIHFAFFFSMGTVKDELGLDELGQMSIPIPDLESQSNILDIYNVYLARKNLNEKLKLQIKNICPILIKGAIEEGKSKRG